MTTDAIKVTVVLTLDEAITTLTALKHALDNEIVTTRDALTAKQKIEQAVEA